MRLMCKSLITTEESSPMIPSHRTPTHPGEILLEEFLVPLGITQVQTAATHSGVLSRKVRQPVKMPHTMVSI